MKQTTNLHHIVHIGVEKRQLKKLHLTIPPKAAVLWADCCSRDRKEFKWHSSRL